MIDQARKDKFRIRNVDELAGLRVAAADALPPTVLVTNGASPPQMERRMYDYQRTDEQKHDNTEKATSETRSVDKKRSDNSV